MQRLTLAGIDRERAGLKISVARLCAAAGVSPSTYWRMRADGQSPRRDTLARLKIALERARRGWATDPRSLALHAAYKGALVLVAQRWGGDPTRALESDPGKRATASVEWMEAARLRRLAVFVLNQFLNVRQADTARAACMTKQAVQQTIKEVEDERDGNAELDRWLDEMERAFG